MVLCYLLFCISQTIPIFLSTSLIIKPIYPVITEKNKIFIHRKISESPLCITASVFHNRLTSLTLDFAYEHVWMHNVYITFSSFATGAHKHICFPCLSATPVVSTASSPPPHFPTLASVSGPFPPPPCRATNLTGTASAGLAAFQELF